MRIVIASDLHGSAAAARNISQKVKELAPDRVVILGDILYHGPRNPLPIEHDPQNVVTILGELAAPVIAVRGNCDADIDQVLLPFHLAESAWIFDGPHSILAIHGHQLPENEAEIKALKGSAILSGHIHIPVAEKRGSFHFWNPGSAALPKENYPPGFGLYENGKFTAMDFSGNILKSDSL